MLLYLAAGLVERTRETNSRGEAGRNQFITFTMQTAQVQKTATVTTRALLSPLAAHNDSLWPGLGSTGGDPWN